VLVTHLTSGASSITCAAAAAPLALDSRQGEPVNYGARVPLLRWGGSRGPNHVTHVPLELSSVTKFLEWNWLGGEIGQLGHRDTWSPTSQPAGRHRPGTRCRSGSGLHQHDGRRAEGRGG